MKLLRPALFACCLALAPAIAQEPTATGPQIREVSAGIFEIGQIRLDQKARTVTFPATVNKAAKDDLLEYLLVGAEGATHESLLLTKVVPTDLHFAMLLLGAKGAADPATKSDGQGGGQINAEFLKHAPRLTGDAIQISAKWRGADGTEKTMPIEDWILNLATGKAMTRGSWLYTGSSFIEGKFRAQTESCFGALVIYPPALINNPRKGNDQDNIWAANATVVPPVDTPLELIIALKNPVP